MRSLQHRWETGGQLPTDGIQVNGDSGNDAELFEVPGVYGCIVSNAMPELAAWADAHPSDMLFRCSPALCSRCFNLAVSPLLVAPDHLSGRTIITCVTGLCSTIRCALGRSKSPHYVHMHLSC